MNTKGIKFLAVLAVLAMAFAAFAVVSDNETSDAGAVTPTANDYIAPGGTTKTVSSIEKGTVASLAADTAYVILGDVEVTTVAASATIYVGTGYTLTLKAITGVEDTKGITVIPVSIDTTAKKLALTSGIEMKYTGTTDAKFKAVSVTTVELTEVGTISTGTIPAGAEVSVNGELTITGEVKNNGIVKITGNNHRIILDGSADLTSDDKGTVIVEAGQDSTLTTGPDHAIVMMDGTFQNQNVIAKLCKNPSDATKNDEHAFMSLYGAMDSGIIVKNNVFNMERPNAIVLANLSGSHTATITGNVFNSTIDVDQCVLVRDNISCTGIVINSNDYSGIKGYVVEDGKYEKTILKFYSADAAASRTIGVVGATGVLIQTDITNIGVGLATTLTIAGDMELDYLGIRADGSAKVVVQSGVKLTNNGEVIVGGTLEFERTDNNKEIKNIGLQGSGKITVKSGGVFIANQGKSGSENNVLASGSNTITVEHGGKMFVHQAGDGGKYWCLVGNAPQTTGEPHVDDYTTATTFMIATTAAKATVTIVADMSGAGELQFTTYSFKEAVTLGSSHEDSINDYFGRKDIVNINGTLTLEVPLTIRENVTFNVLDGAKIDSAASQAITLSGTIVYSDAAQVYKNTTVVEDKGKVIVKGSEGDEEPTIITDKTDIKTTDFDGVDVVVTTGKVIAATVPSDKTLVIESAVALANPVLDVTATGSAVSIVGTGSFTIKLTADSQITVSGFTGSATFSKGSIVINGVEAFGATMTLADKDVVKLSGAIGEVTFNNPATGSAEILISEKTTIGTSITYGNKISMKISAEVTGGAIINAGDLEILKGAKVTSNITTTGDVTVYSGSDINGIGTVNDWTKVTGKDENGGTWTWDSSAAKALKLNGYNGTYNFAKFKGEVKKLTITGTNSVSYSFKATDGAAGNLIGGGVLEKITTSESGSLTINVDISKVKTEKLFKDGLGLEVIKAAGLTVEGVDIVIVVSGSNDTWVAADFEAMKIKGIVATSFSAEDSDIYISIVEDITTKATATDVKTNVNGICSSVGNVTMKGSNSIYVASAGTAIKSAGDVKFDTFTGTVAIDGKKVGIDATGKGLTVETVADMIVKGGIKVQNFTAKKAVIDIKGTSTIEETSEGTTVFELKSSASVTIAKGLIKVDGATITQESTLTLNDVTVDSPVKNEANLVIAGNVPVTGSITNEKDITVSGTLGIYGSLNNKGTLTNEGNVEILGKKYDTTKAFTVTVTDAEAASADHVKLAGITITPAEIKANADGTATVEGTVTFSPAIKLKTGTATFTGTLKPLQTGDVGNSYELTISNDTASIRVVYDKTNSTPQVGEAYAISVEGYVITDTEKTMYLQANKTKTTGVAGATVETTQTAVIASGAEFTNTGIYGGNLVTDIADVAVEGSFVGNLTANGAGKVTIGNFLGNVVAAGEVELSAEKSMMGSIDAKGNVAIKGTILGNIASEGSVSVADTGSVTGDITVTTKAMKTLTVAGKVDGKLTFVSKYKAAKDDTTDSSVEMIMDIDADMSGSGNNFVVNMTASKDAVGSEAGAPGWLSLGTLAAPDENKSVDFELTKGKLVSGNVTLPVRYTITIEKDTIMEVSKGSTLNVKNAALVVSKDAISNFNIDAFGKVTYKMSFTVEDGAWTIYSNVAFALSNCEENSTLEVGESDVMTQSIEVKAGVNIIVKDVTLDFSSYGLSMEEGAKITIQNAGKVLFAATGQDYHLDDETKDYEFFTVSGTIVFDDTNVIMFDDVRFDGATSIQGVAATAKDPSKLSVDLKLNEGTAAIAGGYATGKVTLSNTNYSATKADAEAVPVVKKYVSGELYVDEDAVFAAEIVDAPAAKTYNEETKTLTVTALATIVTNNGTVQLSKDTIVNGTYLGLGTFELAEGKKITVMYGNYLDNDKTMYYGPIFTGKVIDTTDDGNGYALAAVMTQPNLKTGAATNSTLEIKAVKNGSDYYVTLKGDMFFGMANATTAAVLDVLKVYEGASITAASVKLIGNVTIKGMISTILMDLNNKTLTYDTTYMVDEYTVFTVFKNVDFDEVSDVYIANNVDLDGKLDLSGRDVNIEIAEGKALTVNKYLIIGTPDNELGGEGSSIVGKVIVAGENYLVVYADVDLSEAIIVTSNAANPEDAVVSKLDIEGTVYAYIFGDEDAVTLTLAKADSIIVPEIAGYNFTAWMNYNGNAGAKIGETNAYADAKATYVTVIVKYVAGVDYYMNGLLFDALNVYTDVPYGSYFTAKISDTSKYQGNPLVNGEKTVYVIDDMELVASGVTPIPEPTPEPVEENTGLTLTDILLIVLVILIAIMVVILVLRLNRS